RPAYASSYSPPSLLLRDLTLFGLLDADQAPRTLFHRVRELIQIFGSHTQVFHGVVELVIVRSNCNLEIHHQSSSFLQSVLQFSQIFTHWFAHICNGAIHVLNRVISMLAERD